MAREFSCGNGAERISRKSGAARRLSLFCLSKGLGAPVGSILLGEKAFIDEARAIRKDARRGMRQAGVLAAAGLIALEESPKGLPEDHANAKRLRKVWPNCRVCESIPKKSSLTSSSSTSARPDKPPTRSVRNCESAAYSSQDSDHRFAR